MAKPVRRNPPCGTSLLLPRPQQLTKTTSGLAVIVDGAGQKSRLYHGVAQAADGLPRPCALRSVRAGVQLGVEVAESDAWPLPPQPCGVIAGTRSLSAVNPTSWLTSSFRMLQGEDREWACHEPSAHGLSAPPHRRFAKAPLGSCFLCKHSCCAQACTCGIRLGAQLRL